MILFPNRETKNCNNCKRPQEEKDFLCRICKRRATDYWEEDQQTFNLKIS